jgi:hypothetical protein
LDGADLHPSWKAVTFVTAAVSGLNGPGAMIDCFGIRAKWPGRVKPNRMEIIMTASKQQKNETKTAELSEAELRQVSGGIIAVLQQKSQMCDGSVRPVAPQAEHGIIAV